jgi:hypothetical protein
LKFRFMGLFSSSSVFLKVCHWRHVNLDSCGEKESASALFFFCLIAYPACLEPSLRTRIVACERPSFGESWKSGNSSAMKKGKKKKNTRSISLSLFLSFLV